MITNLVKVYKETEDEYELEKDEKATRFAAKEVFEDVIDEMQTLDPFFNAILLLDDVSFIDFSKLWDLVVPYLQIESVRFDIRKQSITELPCV